ncbi:MAG: hypothetical protein R2729_24620 [Bryobacteraceae bacterium]
MPLFDQIRASLPALPSFLDDPPPAYAFEISAGGVAHAVRPAKRGQPPEIGFRPFESEVLAISPVNDNVLHADAFAAHVAALLRLNGRRRDAAVILPDYCARVAILDFDSFSGNKEEQLSLVRFRMKKTVPFDLDTAAVSYHARKAANGHTEAVVVAAARDIVTRYEAPFRAAGFNPGLVTTSTLAALDLLPASGLAILTKLAGPVLTVALCDGRDPKLVRCVELADMNLDEVMAVLYPTVAFAEDTLGRRPDRIVACGFGGGAPIGMDVQSLANACVADLSLETELLRSTWGPAHAHDAGLLGWFSAQEGGH